MSCPFDELAGAKGASPTFIPAKLIAYNGKPFKTKAPTIIFSALVNANPAAELDFTAALTAKRAVAS
jgi:hypothetical protein